MPYIRSLKIPTFTLPDLLHDAAIDRMDLLHIDTEGHDWIILSQLDFRLFGPQLILFEIEFLSPYERTSAINTLSKRYWIYDLGRDALAIDKTAARRFVWSRFLIRKWLLTP